EVRDLAVEAPTRRSDPSRRVAVLVGRLPVEVWNDVLVKVDGEAHSFRRRSLSTISTIAGTVSRRAQSRCSSQASDTQLIGCAPAWTTRSSPARWASSDVPPIASTTG